MSCSATQRSVTIVGLGTIGSHALPLLCRVPFIHRMVLVDPDRYGVENLSGQNICNQDPGLPKVEAMRRQTASISNDIRVEIHALPVEDVPLGRLRSDLLISCVDSRRARQSINSIACRLGVPWIDGAVEGSALLGRVAAYPARGACLECRWSDAEYSLLEQVYACQRDTGPAPTNAPAELGALVAANQVVAARELLSGDFRSLERELYFNARNRDMSWAEFRRNSACRFDHRALRITDQIDLQARLADLRLAYSAIGLSLEGHGFVLETTCPDCRESSVIPPMLSRVQAERLCSNCGSEVAASGFHTRDVLPLDVCADITLADVGLLPADIVTLHCHARTGSPICIDLEIGRSS